MKKTGFVALVIICFLMLSEMGFSQEVFVAAKQGDVELIRDYLQKGGDIDVRIHNATDYPPGGNLLMVAAEYEQLDVVKTLIENKANVNAIDDRYNTALIYAAFKGNAEIASAILSRKPKVDFQNRKSHTALMEACQFGNIEFAKLLLKAGAKTEIKDSSGWTALFYGIDSGNVDLVALLLSKGSKIDVRDNAGATPLIAAMQSNRKSFEMCKLLIDHKVKLNLKDGNGDTALLIEIGSTADMGIIQLLIDAKADLNVRNESGETALIVATKRSREDIKRLLIDSGAKE
jgi:ankyrin repeat protein